MTSSPSSLFDEKWDIELTLDWLQALVLRRGRWRAEEQQGEGASLPPPSNVNDNRNQKTIRRVVLQFPDALLPVALAVQARLSAGSSVRGLDLEFYVLADSTFNPAAVDELACVRGGGDAVVHYGRAEAPLLSDSDDEDKDDDDGRDDDDDDDGRSFPPIVSSSSCSFPTFFVFGRRDLNVPAVARAVFERAEALRDAAAAASPGVVSAVVVLPDQPLSHAAGALRREIAALVAAAEADGKMKLPAVVVAAPAFRAVEPRAAARKQRPAAAVTGASQQRRGRGRRPFDAREPARSQTLGGLTWTLPVSSDAISPASCAFVWVGPGDDDDEGDENGEEENGPAGGGFFAEDDEACSSARQLLRLSLAASAAGGWAKVNPRTGRLRVPSPLGTRRLLGRRYFAVQKAANAALVGVVTATSAGGEKRKEEEGEEATAPPSSSPSSSSSSLVPAHVAASDALMRLARAAGKRPYALAMGRPTAAKLSNFPELGAFVLVAPPGGQLPPPGTLEALAPVLTPAEAVIAWGCGKRSGGKKGGVEEKEGEEEDEEEEGSDDDDPASRWDPSSYSLDSLPAVARAANAAAEALERRSRRRARRHGGEGGGGGGGVARLSLVDGVSYNNGSSSFPASTSSPSSSSQLALRQDGVLASTDGDGDGRELTCAADFLASRRSWRGLETPATGGVPAAEAARAVEGRSGRAAGYEGEGDK